ncbi:unnamed protein product [Orchesella dallaii]|uniref:Uncharacterized protein n=1 Tax=Orchesella dallaii TaxID=48710 RepID=A0ABP1Q3X3_9HEXA
MRPRFSVDTELTVSPASSTDTFKILRGPMEFNKRQLWSQDGTAIPTFIFQGMWTFFEKYSTNFRECSLAVLNAKYKISPYCNYDVMTSIYLEEAHNLTLNFINVLLAYEGNYTTVIKTSPQFISNTKLVSLVPTNTQGFSFSGQYAEQLLYCNKLGQTRKGVLKLDYAVWTQPFSPALWLLILPLLYIGCVLCNKKMQFSSSGLTLIALICRQGIPFSNQQFKIIIFLDFFIMILSNIWNNGIVSLIVVPPSTPHMETLQEFIENGYKILHPSYITDPYSRYEMDFNVSGVKIRKDMFQVFEDKTDFCTYLAENKFGWPLKSDYKTLNNHKQINKDFRRQDGISREEWWMLDQKFLPTIIARDIQTYNRTKAFGKNEFAHKPDSIVIALMKCHPLMTYCSNVINTIYKNIIGKPVVLVFLEYFLRNTSVYVMRPRFSVDTELTVSPASSADTFAILRRPTEFNKLQLCTQDRTPIPTLIFQEWGTFFEEYDTNFRDCSVAVLNARYKISPYCNYDVMTSIYLEEAHNLTLNFINLLLAYEENHAMVIKTSPQFISNTKLVSLVPTNTQGFSYSGQYAEQLIYCTKVGQIGEGFLRLDYAVWTQPFSPALWILVLPLLCIMCVLCNRKLRILESGLTLIALICGQGIPFSNQHFKIIIFLDFFIMILSNIWNNGIVSLIVVPPATAHMETLTEFIENGYKILHSSFIADPYARYEMDFNVSGVKIEKDMFQVLEDGTDFCTYLAENKFGWPLNSDYKNLIKQKQINKDSRRQDVTDSEEWWISDQKLMLTIIARDIQTYNSTRAEDLFLRIQTWNNRME